MGFLDELGGTLGKVANVAAPALMGAAMGGGVGGAAAGIMAAQPDPRMQMEMQEMDMRRQSLAMEWQKFGLEYQQAQMAFGQEQRWNEYTSTLSPEDQAIANKDPAAYITQHMQDKEWQLTRDTFAKDPQFAAAHGGDDLKTILSLPAVAGKPMLEAYMKARASGKFPNGVHPINNADGSQTIVGVGPNGEMTPLATGVSPEKLQAEFRQPRAPTELEEIMSANKVGINEALAIRAKIAADAAKEKAEAVAPVTIDTAKKKAEALAPVSVDTAKKKAEALAPIAVKTATDKATALAPIQIKTATDKAKALAPITKATGPKLAYDVKDPTKSRFVKPDANGNPPAGMTFTKPATPRPENPMDALNAIAKAQKQAEAETSKPGWLHSSVKASPSVIAAHKAINLINDGRDPTTGKKMPPGSMIHYPDGTSARMGTDGHWHKVKPNG